MANPYIDVLAGQSWLHFGFDNHLTYFFDDSGLRSWTAAEKANFAVALQSWANVANVTFEEVTTAAAADLTETLLSSSAMDLAFGTGAIGAHYMPDASGVAAGFFAGDGATTNPYAVGNGVPVPGTAAFATFVHELGHALGLAHPHSDAAGAAAFPGVTDAFSTGTGGLNQTVYTIMSYNDYGNPTVRTGNAAGPMAFDIAAIQQMYGANTTYHSGNDTYSLDSVTLDSKNAFAGNEKWVCIWDAGGDDTITFSRADDVTIDLRAATLQPGEGAGGYLSQLQSPLDFPGLQGGFTIANGAVIENATSGAGNDTLIGNATDNTLNGGNGTNKLYGGAGSDTLIGGSGIDVLSGGSGADKFYGGGGNDTYYIDDAGDSIVPDTAGSADAVYASVSYALAAQLENLILTGAAASATGNAGNNVLTGNGLDNTLSGNGGADTLNGGLGNDTLIGGDGGDTYVLADGNDSVIETGASGIDTITSTISRSLSAYAGIENLTLLGTANINATGNAFGNTLTGNAGNNILDGGIGGDHMSGGAGNDTYIVDTYAYDVVTDSSGTADNVTSSKINIDMTKYAGCEIGQLTGALALSISGTAGNDTLKADTNSAGNALQGLAGNDTYIVGVGDRVIESAGAAGGIDIAIGVGRSIDISTLQFANVENAALRGAGAFNLTGSSGNNVLTGNGDANKIAGLGGRDILSGGLGIDTFVYKSVADSGATAATRDVILDFNMNLASQTGTEIIDLSAIDANGAAAGNGTFIFQLAKGAAFTGAAGQLHYFWDTAHAVTIVEGDVNGDRTADFQIEINGLSLLAANEFIL